MATQAQIHANRANAAHSTGPRTDAGKARASRSNLHHGLTLGFLYVEPAEQDAYGAFEAEFRAELKPDGRLETEAFTQFIESAWRLQKIQALMEGKIAELEADLRSLIRHRAAAEMAAHRAIRTLGELQTTRYFRLRHLAAEEHELIPPMVTPAVKIMCDNVPMGRHDRELYYAIYGLETLYARFAASNPMPPRHSQ